MSDMNGISEVDLFAEMKRQHDEFMKLISKSAVEDLIGVVNASGIAGSSTFDRSQWNLIIHFDGWRRIGETMQTETLRIEMPVDRDAIPSYRERIKPYDIIQVRGRVATHPTGRAQAWIQEIISTEVSDPELEAYAAELQKPVEFIDPKFGTFRLNRAINWFTARIFWCGKPVVLQLSMDNAVKIDQPLQVANELWEAEYEWEAKLIDFATQKLLSLKNECWLEENEAEIGPDEFKVRMTLESIMISPDGGFEFWFNDGDLFWGHSIMVKGSLRGGLYDASIHG